MNYIGEDFENYIEPEGICKECKVSSLCQKCWGTNLASTGSIHNIDPWLCVINRILMLAGAKILYNQIISKKELDEAYHRKLKGIQIVLEEAFNEKNKYLKDW